MLLDDFLSLVPKISKMPLPGREAQFQMAPFERIKELKEIDIATLNPRQAAVMCLFYPKNLETYIALILRKTYKGVHSNQVGFPGGKVEESDANLLETALRETHEEIGVPASQITTIKELTNIYIPPSNFWVQSYMGFMQTRPSFVLQEDEVESLIEVPLNQLLADSSIGSKSITTSYAINIQVPMFELEGHVVWGATAMMLSEVKALLQKSIEG